MVKILFICHGNICRSPMAEFFMRDYVKKKNRAAVYEIASAATSSEEIGNLVHYGTRKELEKLGISTAGKRARKLTEADGKYYDFLIAMDRFNVRDTERIVGANYAHKIFRLLDFTKEKRDVADPWYTGDFDATLKDVVSGCTALFEKLENGELQ